MPSFNNPDLSNAIAADVPEIRDLLRAVASQNYAGVTNIPLNAIRWNASNKLFEMYNGTAWDSLGKLAHDVETVDGFSANAGTVASTIPVRNSAGVLPGNIAGNAATATSATALSQVNPVNMGGTGASNASQARINLGILSSAETDDLAETVIARRYGTCTTAAGTVAKVASVAGFVRKNGSIVGVKFTNANTAANATLNVNSTGAAPIFVNGAATTGTDGAIVAGMVSLFQFDGTNWILLNANMKDVDYGTCTTAAGTVAKVGTLPGFVRRVGGLVVITFTNANTANNPTLNVGGTGAAAIQVNGVNLTSTGGEIVAGMTALFQFDGTYWQLLNSSRAASADKLSTARNIQAKAADGALGAVVAWDASGPLVLPLPDVGGRGFNTRQIITASGSYIVPTTGWYKVTAASGGGGGGGGGTGANMNGGGGGGGAGNVEVAYIYLTKSASVSCTVGAGGNGGAAGVNGSAGGLTRFGSYLTAAASTGGTDGYGRGGRGGPGASNGNAPYDTGGGPGGSGGRNWTGYGGGGGGGAGHASTASDTGGHGVDGASNGSAGTATVGGPGGAGGAGAIILEYFDPDL